MWILCVLLLPNWQTVQKKLKASSWKRSTTRAMQSGASGPDCETVLSTPALVEDLVSWEEIVAGPRSMPSVD